MGVELSLHGTEELYVRIKPQIQDHDGVLYSWTASGIQLLRGKLAQTIKACLHESKLADQRVAALKAYVNASPKTSTKPADRERFREQLRVVEAEAVETQNRLTVLQDCRDELAKIEDLGKEVDRKGRINFRVVQVVDGVEVAVVQTRH